jgi:Lipocalin-like domain
MKALEGVWKLTASRAWDAQGKELPAPYGQHPLGHIVFSQGRMLAALCKGDAQLPADASRGFSSYGGTFSFDGMQLDVAVDMASDPSRIGGHQLRNVTMNGDEMILRPPQRPYGSDIQQRELVWKRIWQPSDTA